MTGFTPDNPTKLRFKNGHQLSNRSTKLELLDSEGNLVSYGTGLLMIEEDAVYLYTCWHVVTGYDFLDLKVKNPPKIRSVALHTKTVKQENPAVVAIGGEARVIYPLYDDAGLPRWQQQEAERSHPDLNAIGLRVPEHCDVVRLPVSLNPLASEYQAFNRNEIWFDGLEVGTQVMIAGYPYGYSAFQFPEPIFLTRAIASVWTKIPFMQFIDGAGARGMSGSPVYAKVGGSWALFGIYTGILFPDHELSPPSHQNDRHAALGLLLNFRLARIMLGVKDFRP